MLFSPLTIRGVTLRNRICVSPMCQYSSQDGFAGDWHLVHLGQFAVGGAAVVFTEAAAVEARGRISPQDLGVWLDEHFERLARIAAFVERQGALAGVQLAHAGRKASTAQPWKGGGAVAEGAGGWRPVAPSAIAFSETSPHPEALDESGIAQVIAAFGAAAARARDAGFSLVEIHGAHGYLLHQFLSPLANRRDDRWGGSFENRTRLVREVIAAIRAEWPERLPLFLRISATDWAEGGWELEQAVELARMVKPLGVDLIDCSSGGMVPRARIPIAPGYQVPFAERIRSTGIATGAVGMITDPAQAEAIVAGGQADVVLLARELLRDPHWPLRAAKSLGVDVPWPNQYARAKS
jgi:2,4-dienoyl-CoA reductase-like NADH-dependent reductase (Old Yellow Enzyme family)